MINFAFKVKHCLYKKGIQGTANEFWFSCMGVLSLSNMFYHAVTLFLLQDTFYWISLTLILKYCIDALGCSQKREKKNICELSWSCQLCVAKGGNAPNVAIYKYLLSQCSLSGYSCRERNKVRQSPRWKTASSTMNWCRLISTCGC